MKFMLMIYGDESLWGGLPPETIEAEMGAYFAYTAALREAGKLVEADELHPVASAKSVSVMSGAPVVKDGPYVDTKEQFGGYYLIEAQSIEEALEWAAKCPGARYGGVEVRPVVMR